MQSLKRYFLELSYKGTAYHGWQVQPNAITVQEILHQALKIFFKRDIETLGCGRTDTGVHASNFYAHFDLPSEIELEEDKFLKSINSLLPYDIAASRILSVANSAHARFDATLRTYQYHIHFRKDPFRKDTSWLVKESLDVKSMQRGADIIKGYDDFGAFCKSNADNFTNICHIEKADWENIENGLIFHISANRFLRNMVRAIVGTLVDIGKGKLSADAMHEIIQSQHRSSAGASVPACGLILTEVRYPYIKTNNE